MRAGDSWVSRAWKGVPALCCWELQAPGATGREELVWSGAAATQRLITGTLPPLPALTLTSSSPCPAWVPVSRGSMLSLRRCLVSILPDAMIWLPSLHLLRGAASNCSSLFPEHPFPSSPSAWGSSLSPWHFPSFLFLLGRRDTEVLDSMGRRDGDVPESVGRRDTEVLDSTGRRDTEVVDSKGWQLASLPHKAHQHGELSHVWEGARHLCLRPPHCYLKLSHCEANFHFPKDAHPPSRSGWRSSLVHQGGMWEWA